LSATIAALPDDRLTGFALRLGFTDYTAVPRVGEVDFLTEAGAAFAVPQPKKASKPKQVGTPTRAKASPKKKAARKKVAA
jgi:ParB family chromosome partitioning protein